MTKKIVSQAITLFFLISFLPLFSEEYHQLVNQLAIGPEYYWVNRTREGGTEQKGSMWGARLTYNRLKRYGWYIGGDALYATGTLKGHSGQGSKLRSQLTDKYIEGRIGYTFQQKEGCNFAFSPFFGIGYFHEQNNYSHPRDLPIHVKNTFGYVPVGFLSSLYVSNEMTAGIKFTARILFNHKNRISNDPDPDFNHIKQQYEEKVQYRVEVPLTYDLCFYDRLWRISLDPFFEYRHYGNMPNFPVDFKDTKFRIYGVNLQIVTLF